MILNKLAFLCFSFYIFISNAQEISKTEYIFKEEKEKLINHYKKDSNPLKLKAANFLLNHMDIHYSSVPYWTNSKGEILNINELQYNSFEESTKVFDSLSKLGLKQKTKKELDSKFLNAEFLINNIEESFAVWENAPWFKKYSFEVFCEYILPYRNDNEPITKDWKKKYYHIYKKALYEASDSNDPIEVCTELINSIKYFQFSMVEPYSLAPLSIDQSHFRGSGTCTDLAGTALLLGRALGLAITYDYTPYYAASSNAHYWNTVVNASGEHIPFNGTGVIPYAYKPNEKRLGKVFRKTFSNQKEALSNYTNSNSILGWELRKKNVIDVTNQYVTTKNIPYTFEKSTTDSLAYITVFNRGKWKPLWWAKITLSNKVVYNNMGVNVVYLPALKKDILIKGKPKLLLKLEKYPIKVDNEAVIQILKPNFKNTFNCNINTTNKVENSYIDFNTVEFVDEKTYNLYYWNGYWKLFKSIVCKEQSLSFNGLPSNTLFKVLPEKPDNFERIFTINSENCQIEWF